MKHLVDMLLKKSLNAPIDLPRESVSKPDRAFGFAFYTISEPQQPTSVNEQTLKKPSPDRLPSVKEESPEPMDSQVNLRIDTVHQGDLDKQKGVYHINVVDEITQFEMILSIEKISEHFLIPVLEQLLETFPFIIKGFHSDNGSEYINKPVEKLLNKLLIGND